MLPGKIRLGLLDHHTLIRAALKNFLSQQENLVVSTDSESAAFFLAALRTTYVDVVLIDIQLPGTDSFEVVKTVRIQYPHVKVIILSENTDLRLVNRLVDIGVNAFIAKTDDPRNLLKAITAVSENKLFRNTTLTEALYLSKVLETQTEQAAQFASFNDRDKKILQLLWEEKTNKEIADEIFLSVRSVEKIRQDLKEKLQVKSTIGLLKYALTNSIIELK